MGAPSVGLRGESALRERSGLKTRQLHGNGSAEQGKEVMVEGSIATHFRHQEAPASHLVSAGLLGALLLAG